MSEYLTYSPDTQFIARLGLNKMHEEISITRRTRSSLSHPFTIGRLGTESRNLWKSVFFLNHAMGLGDKFVSYETKFMTVKAIKAFFLRSCCEFRRRVAVIKWAEGNGLSAGARVGGRPPAKGKIIHASFNASEPEHQNCIIKLGQNPAWRKFHNSSQESCVAKV